MKYCDIEFIMLQNQKDNVNNFSCTFFYEIEKTNKILSKII